MFFKCESAPENCLVILEHLPGCQYQVFICDKLHALSMKFETNQHFDGQAPLASHTLLSTGKPYQAQEALQRAIQTRTLILLCKWLAKAIRR